jgi:beta-lactamase regulating signal transducer with metallopeptidase domain
VIESALLGAGLWVLRTSIEASVLILLVLGIERLAGDRLGARVRHALWMVVLVRLFLPVAPPSPVSMFNWLPELRLPSVPAPAAPDPTVAGPDGNAAGGSDAARVDVEPGPRTAAVRPTAVAAAAWIFVALALAVSVVLRSRHLLLAVRRRRALTTPHVLEMLEDCRRDLGVTVPVTIVPTPEGASPALLGFVRPRIVLPEWVLDRFDPPSLRLLLLHEVAHIRRRDVLVSWLAATARILHWFNPLVALAVRRMRADRELATDAMVLSTLPHRDRQIYGAALVEIAGGPRLAQPSAGAVGVLEDFEEIRRRITLIGHHSPESGRWSLPRLALVASVAATTLTSAATGGRGGTLLATPGNGAAADSAAARIERAYLANDATGLQAARNAVRRDLDRGLRAETEEAMARYTLAYADWRLATMDLPERERIALLAEGREQALAAVASDPENADFHVLSSAIHGVVAGMIPAERREAGIKANAAIARALELGPDNPRALFVQGLNTFHTPPAWGGSVEQARLSFERALAAFESGPPAPPWPNWGRPDTHAWLGQVHERLGERERARAEYGKAIALAPDYWARDLRAALDRPAP